MEALDRRKFLKGSSVAVGLAGAMAVVPAALPALAKATQGTPKDVRVNPGRHDEDPPEELIDSGEPVVAHVRDARKGQIDLFVGTRHVTLQDRGLTNRILSAAR